MNLIHRMSFSDATYYHTGFMMSQERDAVRQSTSDEASAAD